jgi:Protein of unknown function (DUF3105).
LPGFYREETPRPGNLVHALEHGNIVIYYDPVRVSAADQERIRALCEQYFGLFDGVACSSASPELRRGARCRLSGRVPGPRPGTPGTVKRCPIRR